MKIGKQFNQLSKGEYLFYIDNYSHYSDFNTLGLYRSICENEGLELNERIEVRDYANSIFEKTFNFFQLKDPKTYFDLITLGLDLTIADERQIWSEIRFNQKKILADKKIKHRNFGTYSKHDCGYDHCPYNGLMIKQGSSLSEASMHFKTDNIKVSAQKKSLKNKKQRKNKHQILKDEFEK